MGRAGQVVDKQQNKIMHSTKRVGDRVQEYNKHKVYLGKIKSNSLYTPRYDMLSLHNNLLLHRNFDPKKDLQPKPQSRELSSLQQKIFKRTRLPPNTKVEEKVKWFQEVLSREEATEGTFKCEYLPASKPVSTVRDHLSKIYNLPRHSQPLPRQLSIYKSLYDLQ